MELNHIGNNLDSIQIYSSKLRGSTQNNFSSCESDNSLSIASPSNTIDSIDPKQQVKPMNTKDIYKKPNDSSYPIDSLDPYQQEIQDRIFETELLESLQHLDLSKNYSIYDSNSSQSGQVSVKRNDALNILNDQDSDWWLVEVQRTQDIGYLQVDNIETAFERLARINVYRNLKTTTIALPHINSDQPQENQIDSTALSNGSSLTRKKSVTFSSDVSTKLIDREEESDTEFDDSEFISKIQRYKSDDLGFKEYLLNTNSDSSAIDPKISEDWASSVIERSFLYAFGEDFKPHEVSVENNSKSLTNSDLCSENTNSQIPNSLPSLDYASEESDSDLPFDLDQYYCSDLSKDGLSLSESLDSSTINSSSSIMDTFTPAIIHPSKTSLDSNQISLLAIFFNSNNDYICKCKSSYNLNEGLISVVDNISHQFSQLNYSGDKMYELKLNINYIHASLDSCSANIKINFLQLTQNSALYQNFTLEWLLTNLKKQNYDFYSNDSLCCSTDAVEDSKSSLIPIHTEKSFNNFNNLVFHIYTFKSQGSEVSLNSQCLTPTSIDMKSHLCPNPHSLSIEYKNEGTFPIFSGYKASLNGSSTKTAHNYIDDKLRNMGLIERLNYPASSSAGNNQQLSVDPFILSFSNIAINGSLCSMVSDIDGFGNLTPILDSIDSSGLSLSNLNSMSQSEEKNYYDSIDIFDEFENSNLEIYSSSKSDFKNSCVFKIETSPFPNPTAYLSRKVEVKNSFYNKSLDRAELKDVEHKISAQNLEYLKSKVIEEPKISSLISLTKPTHVGNTWNTTMTINLHSGSSDSLVPCSKSSSLRSDTSLASLAESTFGSTDTACDEIYNANTSLELDEKLTRGDYVPENKEVSGTQTKTSSQISGLQTRKLKISSFGKTQGNMGLALKCGNIQNHNKNVSINSTGIFNGSPVFNSSNRDACKHKIKLGNNGTKRPLKKRISLMILSQPKIKSGNSIPNMLRIENGLSNDNSVKSSSINNTEPGNNHSESIDSIPIVKSKKLKTKIIAKTGLGIRSNYQSASAAKLDGYKSHGRNFAKDEGVELPFDDWLHLVNGSCAYTYELGVDVANNYLSLAKKYSSNRSRSLVGDISVEIEYKEFHSLDNLYEPDTEEIMQHKITKNELDDFSMTGMISQLRQSYSNFGVYNFDGALELEKKIYSLENDLISIETLLK
ncbi:Tip elongation aberrant protein Tea4 [Smittium mucronatum]|uniref:Tip elongation aberrant protein Tea4 n=1 Tax=Smittium mucronatum TaxID=133383 RepID=A0A1R0H4I9_9FUNG|nr:Tip elongation aberrant protein Tea4 [Smittium mucronatum]